MKGVKTMKNRTGKRQAKNHISEEEYAKRVDWAESMNFKPNKHYNDPNHRGKYTDASAFVAAHEKSK